MVPWLFILSFILQRLEVCSTTIVVFSYIKDKLNGNDSAHAFSFLNATHSKYYSNNSFNSWWITSSKFDWRMPFWALTIYSLLIFMLVTICSTETRSINTWILNPLIIIRYRYIAVQHCFIIFALINTGSMVVTLTYVSLSSQSFIKENSMSILNFAMIFGANSLWIILASAISNKIILKIEHYICLIVETILMALSSIISLLSITATPENWQTHWAKLYATSFNSLCPV